MIQVLVGYTIDLALVIREGVEIECFQLYANKVSNFHYDNVHMNCPFTHKTRLRNHLFMYFKRRKNKAKCNSNYFCLNYLQFDLIYKFQKLGSNASEYLYLIQFWVFIVVLLFCSLTCRIICCGKRRRFSDPHSSR